ncbi:MAG: hypothetical protein PVJ98_01525 [Akkermansiaceae bacterium]|jgi:hypothetical protein
MVGDYLKRMLKRRVTLTRVMINLVVLVVALSLIFTFPVPSLRVALKIVVLLPIAAIAFLFARWSNHPKSVFLASLAGGLLGWRMGVPVISWIRPPNFWDLFLVDLLSGLLPGSIGASVFGGVGWFDSKRKSPRASKKRS